MNGVSGQRAWLCTASDSASRIAGGVQLDWLPLPRTRQGWVASFLVVIMAFIAYYMYVFPQLQAFHKEVLYTSEVVSGPLEGLPQNLQIRIAAPRYIGTFVGRLVYITVWNRGTDPVDDLELWLSSPWSSSGTGEEWTTKVGIPPAGGLPYQSAVRFVRIGPGGIACASLMVHGARAFDAHIGLRVGDKVGWLRKPSADGLDLVKMRFAPSPWRSLSHSFVENILLPPWSNAILAGLGLVLTFLAEDATESAASRTSHVLLGRGGGQRKRVPSRLPRRAAGITVTADSGHAISDRGIWKEIPNLVLGGLVGMALTWTGIFALVAFPWLLGVDAVGVVIVPLAIAALGWGSVVRVSGWGKIVGLRSRLREVWATINKRIHGHCLPKRLRGINIAQGASAGNAVLAVLGWLLVYAVYALYLSWLRSLVEPNAKWAWLRNYLGGPEDVSPLMRVILGSFLAFLALKGLYKLSMPTRAGPSLMTKSTAAKIARQVGQ